MTTHFVCDTSFTFGHKAFAQNMSYKHERDINFTNFAYVFWLDCRNQICTKKINFLFADQLCESQSNRKGCRSPSGVVSVSPGALWWHIIAHLVYCYLWYSVCLWILDIDRPSETGFILFGDFLLWHALQVATKLIKSIYSSKK